MLNPARHELGRVRHAAADPADAGLHVLEGALGREVHVDEPVGVPGPGLVGRQAGKVLDGLGWANNQKNLHHI